MPKLPEAESPKKREIAPLEGKKLETTKTLLRQILTQHRNGNRAATKVMINRLVSQMLAGSVSQEDIDIIFAEEGFDTGLNPLILDEPQVSAPVAAPAPSLPTPEVESSSPTIVPPTPPLPSTVRTSTNKSLYIALGLAGGLTLTGMSAAAIYDLTHQKKATEVMSAPTSDAPKAQAAVPNASPAPEAAKPAPTVEATTLYGKVEAVALTQDLLFKAAATNELVSGLYANASSWEEMDSPWKDDTRAYKAVVKKLETWGGYPAVLDSLAASPTPITNIDDALAWIASDGNLDSVDDPNNSDQTALALAKQIALIQDSRIAEDPAQPEADLAKITPEQVKQTVASFVSTPPPSPAHFKYPSTQLDQSASLYDAPEPPMNLKAAQQMAESITAPTPVLVEFEPESASVYDVPEPFYVEEELELDLDPINELDENDLEELALDVIEEEEVLPLLTSAQMGLSSAADVPEAHAIQAAKAPVIAPAPLVKEPEPSFTQKATAAVKGLAAKFGKWFS